MAEQLYLAWLEDEAVDASAEGPWTDVFVLRPGLLLVRSAEGRSPVYHALKHLSRPGAALLLAPLADEPKAKGMADGWTTWLRSAR
jgi:hypothetical protein